MVCHSRADRTALPLALASFANNGPWEAYTPTVPLLRRSPSQTTEQKLVAGRWWGSVAAICIGGSIYLAWMGSWGWLIVGVPLGAWAARRAAMYRREVASNQPD